MLWRPATLTWSVWTARPPDLSQKVGEPLPPHLSELLSGPKSKKQMYYSPWIRAGIVPKTFDFQRKMTIRDLPGTPPGEECS